MAPTDCTDKQGHLRSWLALMAIVAVALCAGWLATGARADGDPASDVLLGQSLFLPQDAGVSQPQMVQLGELLTAAQRNGYRLHVAVIASPADLGSITALWRRPQAYARFLGQELSIVFRGTLLVVMPDGYGVSAAAGSGAAASARHGLGSPGANLGQATIGGVERLAAAAGHPLPQSNASGPATGGSGGSGAIVPWLVFALGLIVIALAWTASLRARPLGSRGSRPAAQ